MSSDGFIALRALIEGIEIPVNTITVEESLWGVTQCNLSVPYARDGAKILERSLVHVFCHDPDQSVFEFPKLSTAQARPELKFNVYPAKDPRNYKLYFWGEVAGHGRTVSVSGESLGISCVGLSNYYDTVPQYQALRGRGTLSDVERRFAGVERPLSESRSGEYATADFLINSLREGGANLQESVKSLLNEFISRTNNFYRDRLALLRLSDFQRAAENDTTAGRLMDLDLFRRFFRQSISSGGAQMTLRGILGKLSEYLFYDFVEHATPSYFPVVSESAARNLSTEFGVGGQEYWSVEAGDFVSEDSSPVVTRENQSDRATAVVYKPELWWTSPPACNILFPEHYSHYTMSVNSLYEPTRTVLKIQPGVNGDRRTIVDNFFAPDLEALNDLADSVDISSQHLFLLPHERFRGVNVNFHMIGELARLVRRDAYQAYLRKYAQFVHWSSVYGHRGVSINSQRLLPQVLVGYPAVLMDPKIRMAPVANDPHVAERIRLRRLRSQVQACLRRLRRRLAYLQSLLSGADSQVSYVQWLYNLGRGIRGISPASLLQDGHFSFRLATTAWARWAEPTVGTYAGIPTYNGRILRAILEWGLRYPPRGAEESSVASFDSLRVSALGPALGVAATARLLAQEGSAVTEGDEGARTSAVDSYLSLVAPILVSARRVLPTPPSQILVRLARLVDLLELGILRIRREIAILRARIRELERVLDEIRARLRELGVDQAESEHLIFYVTGKTTTVRYGEEASTTTSVVGNFCRAHDEDIDLDGTRGDSFEDVISSTTGDFFSEIYSPHKIGEEFYQPVYGVPSLADVGVYLQSVSDTETNSEAADDEGAEMSAREVEWRNIISRICRLSDDTPASGFRTADALEVLADAYRTVGQADANRIRFVNTICARPIATMLDILGARVFEGDEGQEFGNYRGSNKDPGVGFHEFAFLLPGGAFDMSGLSIATADQLDTVVARRDRVLSYVNSLPGVGRGYRNE